MSLVKYLEKYIFCLEKYMKKQGFWEIPEKLRERQTYIFWKWRPF
ncbi:hypothetical protein C8_336 [Cannes 8 virus]|nr:hypothetical protein C8_336 [Cannes 8 virus]